MDTGDDPYNSTGCSTNNSLIYSGAVQSTTTYSTVLPNAEGCEWYIEKEDGGIIVADVPQSFGGSKKCYYNSTDYIYLATIWRIFNV